MALSPALLIAALSVGLLIALWRGFRALISARQGAQARRRAASAARTLDALLEDRPVPAGADDALIPFEPTWKVSALDAQGVVRARLAATLPALLADGSSRADLEKRLTARPSASAVVAALLGTDPSKVQVLTRVVGGGIRERVAARALAARINALNDPRLQLVLAPRDASVDLSGMAGGQVRVLSRPVADGQGQLNPAALNAQFDALAKAQKWTETTADVRLALPADVEFSLSTADLDALALNPALKEALKAFLLAPLAPLRLEQTLESAAVIAQFA